MPVSSLLFRPYRRLIELMIRSSRYLVPEQNTVLRCLQYLAPEPVSYGRFCWNEECQYCRVAYDLGEGTPERTGLACKLEVQPGMRLRALSPELRYCLRELPPELDTEAEAID